MAHPDEHSSYLPEAKTPVRSPELKKREIAAVKDVAKGGISVAKELLSSQAVPHINTHVDTASQFASAVGTASGALTIVGFIAPLADLFISPAILWHGLRKGGEFRPINEHKMAISGQVSKLIGAIIAIGLSAASAAIPGVAIVLGLVAAGVALAVSAHQLSIPVYDYMDAKKQIKKIDKTIQSSGRTEKLDHNRAKLIERTNTLKLINIGSKSGMVVGGVLFAIGVGITLIFPPAAIPIAATGAAVLAVSALINSVALAVDIVQKKRLYAAVNTFSLEEKSNAKTTSNKLTIEETLHKSTEETLHKPT